MSPDNTATSHEPATTDEAAVPSDLALRQLHEAEEILRVVNVWDAITAKVISDLEPTRALATAGHAIAATHGYADGEKIPVDLLMAALARIAAASAHPVSADLDGGFGDAGETTRRAIAVGIVGANVEDQLRPLDESIQVMEAVIAAGQAEGVDFVLNARTDALVKGGDRDIEVSIADAIERGRAYLDVGATTVFVPGVLDRPTTERLVEGIGERKISVIGLPGALSAAEYEALGVARISYGPATQNVVLNRLHDLALDLYAEGTIPEGLRTLN